MKSTLSLLIFVSALFCFSCNENSDSDKKINDSAYSGLEGTREDASQLSNATVDTTSGQTLIKTANDSSDIRKDSLPVK